MSKKRVIFRASVVVCLVVAAFVISSGTLATAERVSETSRSTLARINANFGANYGVVDVSKRTGEEIPGLQSTTVELSVKDSSLTSMNDSLNYVSQTLTNLKNSEVVNVFINGTSEDESQTFSYKFYGSSPDDFAERDFVSGIDVIKTMYAGEVKNATVTSTPALDGSRTVATVLTFSDDYVDAINIKNNWDRSVNTIVEDLDNSSNNLYSLTVVNENEGNGPAIRTQMSYYNEDTLNVSRNVDDRIWKTLAYYATDANLNKFPLNQVSYTNGLQGSQSLMELSFEGDGEGVDDSAVEKAFSDVAGKPGVLPYSYPTQLKYEAHADAFYTQYAE